MANVTMWWAQTNFSSNVPGVAVDIGPNGVLISGAANGPPWPNPFTIAWDQFTIGITAWFWLGPDRVPPTGCEWQSQAIDKTTGSVTGLTNNGFFLFGPNGAPQTTLIVAHKHRVFSGSTLVVEEDFGPQVLLQILTPNSTQTVGLPQSGVFTMFSSKPFDFDRSKGVSIELQVNFGMTFVGDGSLLFNGVNVALPQFDIVSTF